MGNRLRRSLGGGAPVVNGRGAPTRSGVEAEPADEADGEWRAHYHQGGEEIPWPAHPSDCPTSRP